MSRDFSFLEEQNDLFSVSDEVVNRFGERGERALKGVKEGRVKRYRDFWVVVGDREHVVVNGFCDCEDYLYNISSRGSDALFCWHVISVELARSFGEYDEVDDWYLHYLDLFLVT